MLRRRTLGVGLLLTLLAVPAALAADAPPPAARWVPADAVFCVELSNPKALLDVALAPKVVQAVTSQPAYQKLTEHPKYDEFLKGVDYLQKSLHTDWQAGIRKLLGGGVTWSLHPGGGSLLIVDAEDEAMLGQLHEIVRGIAQVQAATSGDADRVQSREYEGVTAWTFGPQDFHAIIGRRLVLSNRKELAKAAMDLRAGLESNSLADVPEYKAAKKSAAGGAATAYVNAKMLKQLPNIEKVLQQNPNPLAALLLAGTTETLCESNWLAAALRVEGDTLRVDVTSDGRPADSSKMTAFAGPQKADEGALPNLDVPRRLAAMSFYRDLHGFYAAKDELFPERTSGLIFFENMMGIFFTGRDLTEEVLGELGPQVRVVVARQEYDPSVGTPQIQVPAFAVVFKLNNPDKFSMVVEEAWQKAIGLVNFTRGQQAQPGLIIDRPTHGGTKFTVAAFSTVDVDEKKDVDMRFNFSPSVARQGDFVVLSSTAGLTCDILDALAKESQSKVESLAGEASVLQLDGLQLAAILAANRESLVRQNMVKEGHTRQEAELQFDMMTTVAGYLEKATLASGTHDGLARTSLTVKLNLP